MTAPAMSEPGGSRDHAAGAGAVPSTTDVEYLCYGTVNDGTRHDEARWGVHGARVDGEFRPDDEADENCPVCDAPGWPQDVGHCLSCRRNGGYHDPECYFA